MQSVRSYCESHQELLMEAAFSQSVSSSDCLQLVLPPRAMPEAFVASLFPLQGLIFIVV